MTSAGKPSVAVIGGTGGIGFAIAKFYADRGSKVVITGRDQERTAAVAKEIGGNTRGIGLDVAEPERVAKAHIRDADVSRLEDIIDRLDTEKGYTPENMGLCCFACNKAKSNTFSTAEMWIIGPRISDVWSMRLSDAGITWSR